MSDITTRQPPTPVWTVPERLAKARRCAGISRSEMADRLRVSERTIRNYEAGKTSPPGATLYAWSDFTDVPLWWIEGDEDPEGEQAMHASRWTDACGVAA